MIFTDDGGHKRTVVVPITFISTTKVIQRDIDPEANVLKLIAASRHGKSSLAPMPPVRDVLWHWRLDRGLHRR